MPVPASPDDKGQAAEAGSTPEGDLATRLAQARQRNRPTALVDGPTLDRLNVDDGIGTGMRSGVEFGAALLISIGIGIALDRWLHTTPIALLVMLVLGFAAGLLNVWRAMKGMGYGQTYKTPTAKTPAATDETDET